MKNLTDLANRKKDTSSVTSLRLEYGDDDSCEVPVRDHDGDARVGLPNHRMRKHGSKNTDGGFDPDLWHRNTSYNRTNRNDRG